MFTLMKGKVVKSRVIKEAIQEIDAKIAEKEYAKNKLQANYKVYDIKVRNIFAKAKVITSMIKCIHSINPYGVWNEMINKQYIRNECP